MQFFLNSAVYLKIGHKIWADRKFSTSAMNGIYHLHASTSGWGNFFNDTYGKDSVKLSQCQVWSAFVNESIRQASELAGIDFVIRDTASIEEVTEEAFTVLGNDGLIQPAKGHECAECSQPYRATSDVVFNPSNSSAGPGVENAVAPTAVQSGSNITAQNLTKMQNRTLRVIDGMVNGTKVFFMVMVMMKKINIVI
jgi:hypothetical protein